MTTRLKILLGVLVVSGAGLGYKLLFYIPPSANQTQQVATPAHGKPTETVMPKVPLKAYSPKKTGVAVTPSQAVLTTAEIPASDGGYTAAAVLDTDTGETTVVLKEESAPLFALGGKTEFGVRAGLTTAGGEQGAVYVRQDVLRVGRAYLAGYGEVNASAVRGPEAKAMVDISLRW